MVIDAAKGIEPQTPQAVRGLPPALRADHHLRQQGRPRRPRYLRACSTRSPTSSALDVCPMSWPVGMGGEFEGIYDFATNRLMQPVGPSKEFDGSFIAAQRPRRSRSSRMCSRPRASPRLRDEAELAQGGYASFDLAAYRHGDLTPVYFGSALKRFGVGELIEALATHAPPPRTQPAEPRTGRARAQRRHRLHLQGAGQYGPAAPRPHRLHAAVLGQVQTRHEADAVRQRQADRGALADPVLRAGSRDRRRGPARRHHRHPQSRHAAGRRYAERKGGRALHRPARISRRKSCAASRSRTRPRPSSCARRSTTSAKRA